MANERIAALRKGGGVPTVRITIGQLRWGSYGVYVTTKDRLDWEVTRKGHAWDHVNAEADLELTPAQLDGRDLWIDLIITPQMIGDPYAATIEICQAGVPVDGGSHPPFKGITDRYNFKLSALVRLVTK